MGQRVGVIGAGISGLTLALKLREAGHSVVVVDKGRGVGGRSATRRTDRASFDHGAQYFTARDPSFVAFLDRYVPRDRLAAWDGPFAKLEDGKLVPEIPRDPRLVGVPGMNAVGRALAASLEVVVGSTVVDLAGSPGDWRLVGADGSSRGPFDWVVSTAPPAQSAKLLGEHSTIGAEAGRVVMQACFALMVEPDLEITFPFAGIRCDHTVLGWVADDRSKPGRGPKPAIVVQSNNGWADAHRDDDRGEIAETLRRAVDEAMGVEIRAEWPSDLHRWLYAKPVAPLGRDCLIDEEKRLACCGDWCVAGKVEGAFLSGQACASAIVGSSE